MTPFSFFKETSNTHTPPTHSLWFYLFQLAQMAVFVCGTPARDHDLVTVTCCVRSHWLQLLVTVKHHRAHLCHVMAAIMFSSFLHVTSGAFQKLSVLPARISLFDFTIKNLPRAFYFENWKMDSVCNFYV